jgi:hypothetical protein
MDDVVFAKHVGGEACSCAQASPGRAAFELEPDVGGVSVGPSRENGNVAVEAEFTFRGSEPRRVAADVGGRVKDANGGERRAG